MPTRTSIFPKPDPIRPPSKQLMPDTILPYPLPRFCQRQFLQFGVEEKVQRVVGYTGDKLEQITNEKILDGTYHC